MCLIPLEVHTMIYKLNNRFILTVYCINAKIQYAGKLQITQELVIGIPLYRYLL